MFYLIRYGEIAIKGDSVRAKFEKILINNIKFSLDEIDFKIINERGRIIIQTEYNIDNYLSHTFGIVSFSKCDGFEIESIDEIKPKLNLDFNGSFAVRVKRVNFPGKSNEIAGDIGSFIGEKTGAKVDLTNPDKVFEIEIRNNFCYLINETIRGLGGLPIGTSGRVYSSLENEKEVEAALLMMKRGCTISTDGDISKIKKYHSGHEITKDGWIAKVSIDNLEDIKKGDELVFYPIVSQ